MTANQLLKAVRERKSIVGFHVSSDISMPAAFLASMQFIRVAEALPRLKIYNPKKNNAPWPTMRTLNDEINEAVRKYK